LPPAAGAGYGLHSTKKKYIYKKNPVSAMVVGRGNAPFAIFSPGQDKHS